MNILETLFLQPLYNALIVSYNVLGDMGLAIIAITVAIRVVLLPLANKALRSQRRLQALQPEMQKLQAKHKDDQQAMARELMAFYRKEGVSPASSCLPLLVQIPFLIALFFVFKDAVGGVQVPLYSFVDDPGQIKTTFLGIVDLAKRDDTFFLPALAAILQFLQSRMLLPKETPGPKVEGAPPGPPNIQKQLLYIFPVLTFVFAYTLPAALPLYWIATTVFTIVQQMLIMRELPLATAKAEGAADWNAANPSDPIALPAKPTGAKKTTSKKRSSRTVKSAKAKPPSKGGPQVTVRKRSK